MGGESSIMDNCHLGKSFPSSADTGYSIQPGETGDGQDITVFLQKMKKHPDTVKKYAKNLKTIRHPYIIRYVATGTTAGVPFLATEQCTPLTVALPDLHVDELVVGINNVITALAFLHDKLQACHNCVCVSSIYVGLDGSWKLGNFEHLTKFSQMTPSVLEKCRESQSALVIPPEELESGHEINPAELYARDVYALGVMVEELLGDITNNSDIDGILEYTDVHLKHSTPTGRPSMNSILNTSHFRNDLLDKLQFLGSLVTKDADDKKTFFHDLLPRLLVYPEELVARRLSNGLLSRFALHDPTAVEMIVPHLLTPRTAKCENHDITPILQDDLFKQYIVPQLIKIFTVRSLHIRMLLLKHFSRYIHAITHEQIVEYIFPQLLLGLRDTNDDLVVTSLQTLALLVPLIGADLIIGGDRFTFFKTGQPKFMRNSPLEAGHVRNNSSDICSVYSEDSKDETQQTPDKQKDTIRPQQSVRKQTDRQQQQHIRDTSNHDSNHKNPEITTTDNDTFDNTQNSDTSPSVRKYGSLENDNGNNALWDIVRNANVHLDISQTETESDTSSLSYNNDSNPVKVYNDDILEQSDSSTKPLRLKTYKPSRTINDNELVDVNDSLIAIDYDDTWLDNDEWPPLDTTTEKSHKNKTKSSNLIQNGGGMKLKSKNVTKHDKKVDNVKLNNINKVQNTQKTKNANLGDEFDVKSIIVASSPTEEVDFFAGMESTLEKTSSKEGESELADKNDMRSSKLFDVKINEESAGWDDQDWGSSDF